MFGEENADNQLVEVKVNFGAIETRANKIVDNVWTFKTAGWYCHCLP